MNWNRITGWSIVCFFAILPLSCGYHLVGTATGFGGGGKISIPVFINNSQEPAIERSVTEKVREAFIRDGRLQVVNTQRPI